MHAWIFIHHNSSLVQRQTGNADRLGAMRAKNTGAMNIHSCPLAAVYAYLAWPITKVTFLTAVFELTTSMRPSYIDTVYSLRYTVNSNWKPASSLQSWTHIRMSKAKKPTALDRPPTKPSIFFSIWFGLTLFLSFRLDSYSSLADVCRDA